MNRKQSKLHLLKQKVTAMQKDLILLQNTK